MVNYSEAFSELKKLLSSDDVVVRELVAGGKNPPLFTLTECRIRSFWTNRC